jgi:hypothetical protein
MTDGEIEKAHVIILVYDVNNLECIKRLRSYWIPRINKINDRVSPNNLDRKILLQSFVDSDHISWQQGRFEIITRR